MRIHVSHRSSYVYETPATSAIQILRLTPRSFGGQTVRKWRIDLSHDGVLRQRNDAFGNIVHTLSLNGPIDEVVVTAVGEVDTIDTHGVVADAYEPFPTGLYLRPTPLTEMNHELADFARDSAGQIEDDRLAALHRLLNAVNREIAFDTEPTHAATTAIEAFKIKSGVCQDLTHIFIGCARALGIPARYVGGYLWRVDGDRKQHQDAGHAWAEAYVPDLGWVGFDPANGISPTDAHVRVAVGLDYLGAAPIRGSRAGGPTEKLDVAVSVTQAAASRQE